MAGSYRHLVDKNNQLHPEHEMYGQFPLIGDLKDARECIEELFAMVEYLTGGDKVKVHEAWLEGYFKPNCPPSNIDLATYERFWSR